MAVNIEIIFDDAPQLNSVSQSHFGLNYVADFQRIGDRGWETFDEIASSSGAQNLRYPGGIAAETVFDITNPNASAIEFEDGGSRAIMGAYDFAEFCAVNDYKASFIIPTISLMKTDLETGDLVFNDSYAHYVEEFVRQTLESSQGRVSVYEIGNEYATHMNAQEYGALANELAPIIKQTIDEFFASQDNIESEPSIALQIRSHSNTSVSEAETEVLVARANGVMAELSSAALAAIDMIVTHWYLKDHGEEYATVYDDIERQVQASASLLSALQSSSDNPMEILISEWNANGKTVPFFGLAQVPVLVKLFSEFVQSGVDRLDFWSAQYQATSLGLASGDMTAAGVTISYLQEHAVGLTPVDLSINSEHIDGVYFSGEMNSIMMLSNTTGRDDSYKIDLSSISNDQAVSRIGYYVMDVAEADGEFQNHYDLEVFNEPDVPVELIWEEFDNSAASHLEFVLSAYQTVFVEFTSTAYEFVPGSDNDDVFFSSSMEEFFDGGSGFDTVIYDSALEGVEISLHDSANSVDQFASIEAVVGSDFDDTIEGNELDNVLNGGLGNDEILGRGGNDTIISGGGNDQVFGGEGDDVICLQGSESTAYGGEGDDIFKIQGYGQYTVFGGGGFNTLDLSAMAEGVYVDATDSEGPPIVYGIDLDISDVDSLITTDQADFLDLGRGDFSIDLGGGNDYVTAFDGAGGQVSTGADNDFVWVLNSNGSAPDTLLSIYTGSGDDFIFSDGGPSDIFGGEGNDTIVIRGGNETVHFDLNDGEDWVYLDAITEDTFSFSSGVQNAFDAQEYWLTSWGGNTELSFLDGGSITFSGIHQDTLEFYIDMVW